MEPTTPAPNPASATHQPRIATPVMDVVPPPATADAPTMPAPSAAQPSQPATQQPASPPAATTPQPLATESPAVRPAPSEHADDLLASEVQTTEADQPAAPEAHATLPEQPKNPTTAPIVMTIIIVVLLSALAIFAYLKSR